MKPFIFKHADDLWPEADTLLHVYLGIDSDRDRALTTLVTRANEALKDFPLTPVPLPWLHVTIDQITDRHAALIPQHERDALVGELTKQLADFAPFEVQVGSLLAYHSGVIADLHPDEQLAALHHTVREAIRTVRGDDAVRYPWSLQHLTISYAREEASSDDAQRILRRVRPSHAPLHVTEVQLVDVTADSTAKTITWERLATIPLGGQ
ncbi:2'-5' RNA ligase family protein [Streptomyces sp. NPDC058280]|uniref:2'-5' RNA ligase family protein n=1 Tax=Streptomyces sp. NPDC058280 TaxID=3346419 RepID=UPI0036E21249